MAVEGDAFVGQRARRRLREVVNEVPGITFAPGSRSRLAMAVADDNRGRDARERGKAEYRAPELQKPWSAVAARWCPAAPHLFRPALPKHPPCCVQLCKAASRAPEWESVARLAEVLPFATATWWFRRSRVSDDRASIGSPVRDSQFVFRALEQTSPACGQGPPGAVDVQVEHRHCGLKRLRLATRAPLGGPLQRSRDPSRVI